MYRAGMSIMLLFMSRNVLAQTPSNSIWMTLQLPVSFSTKWQLHNEAGYRTLGLSTTANQRLYRTGLRFWISEEWVVAGGIAFFSTRTRADKHDHEFGKEFRLWQELAYQHTFQEKVSLQYRLRTEERFLEATREQAPSRIMNINNRVSLQCPVAGKWSVQVAEELFEQLINKKISFNQNRVSAAGIYNTGNTFQLQGTYLWVKRRASDQHVVQFTVRKTILLYESKNSK